MQQLSLFSDAEGRPPLPPPAAERELVFFALLLGPLVFRPLSKLVASQRALHGLTGRMRPSDTFHLSVLGFGYADALSPADLDLAKAVAAGTAFAPLTLRFADLGSIGKKRDPEAPLVLSLGDGAEAVAALAARLRAGLVAHGFAPRPFKPTPLRLTLLDDAVRVPPTPLDPPVTVVADGFALVRSHPAKASYSILWS